MLAEALQQGEDPAHLPVATMMPVLRERLAGEPPEDMRAAVAAAEAATLGWLLFAPLVAHGTGLADLDPAARRRALARAIARMLALRS